MPDAPKTPLRSVRVADPLWNRARAVAAERGDSISDVIRAALEEYVLQHEQEERPTTP